ncbi:hypothetical protein BC332_34591 [Capsicum chinense]|nr:hypothetical protein BC332_34591 [Capsicum chinense]
MGFCFRVQSSDYDPVYLQGRIDNFINGVEKLLDGLDNKSFESYRTGLIAKLLEKDPSLAYETNRFWGQITDKRYMFDMPEKEAEELRSIRKIDLIEWYHTYLIRPSPKCRRLCVRVWGCNTSWKDTDAPVALAQDIKDLTSFKKSAKFYPSLC